MTWKRELAFWAFMFVVGFWFLWAVLAVGTYVSNEWGARVAIERAK